MVIESWMIEQWSTQWYSDAILFKTKNRKQLDERMTIWDAWTSAFKFSCLENSRVVLFISWTTSDIEQGVSTSTASPKNQRMDTQNDGLIKRWTLFKIWPLLGIYVRFLGCIFFGFLLNKAHTFSNAFPLEKTLATWLKPDPRQLWPYTNLFSEKQRSKVVNPKHLGFL